MNDDVTPDLAWNSQLPRPEGNYAMTLEQVSIVLGVTRERVRQIEAAALRKARRILEQRGYSLDDLLH